MTPLTRSYLHRGGTQPLLGATIDQRFREVVASDPSAEALVDGYQDRRVSYGDLDTQVQRLSRGLIALGFGRHDRIGVWSTNNLEWVVLQLATARIGAVLVNINPAYRPRDLEYALRKARVQGLFLEPSFRSSHYADMIRELLPCVESRASNDISSSELPEMRRVVLWDPAQPLATERPAPGFTTWSEVLVAGDSVPDAAIAAIAAHLDADDPINIQFTSGTTGFPKAVVLSHHNLVNNAWFVGDAMAITHQDRLCVPVPFYHCFGMVLANLVCLLRGAAVVLPSPHFEPRATLSAVEAEGCTALHGVPTMFIAELEELDRGAFDTSTLRTGIMAGAPCPPPVVQRVMTDLGCHQILIAYGQTEASPVTHMTLPEDSFEHRVSSVGTNLPHQECKIVDVDTGSVVLPGVQGEVCFRGYHVMRGYFDDPDATAKTIDEAGWLHSGDLGVMEADGYVRITGRLKDMIIRGGENLYPAEIEAVFHEHPDVVGVAVFGVPDEKMGEEVGAWFLLRQGATVDVEALREFGRERMAHFKVPRFLRIVDEFPMTVTGKIQKFRIREMAAEWLSEQDEGPLEPVAA